MKPFTPEFITPDSGIPGKNANSMASIHRKSNEVFGVPVSEELMDAFQVIRGKASTVVRVNPPSCGVGHIAHGGEFESMWWDDCLFAGDENHGW